MKKIIGLLSLIGVVAIFFSALSLSPTYALGSENDVFGSTKAVEKVGVPGTENADETDDKLITIIQNAINWILGLLGLIALALCLYAGFQMTTAAGDTKKFDSGKTIITHAGVGLAIIALAWLIVSLIFWIVNKVSDVPAT